MNGQGTDRTTVTTDNPTDAAGATVADESGRHHVAHRGRRRRLRRVARVAAGPQLGGCHGAPTRQPS